MRIKKGYEIDLDYFPKDLPQGLQDNIGFTGGGWSLNTSVVMVKSLSLREVDEEDRVTWIDFTVFTGSGGLQGHRGKVCYISIAKDRPGEPGRDYPISFELNKKLEDR